MMDQPFYNNQVFRLSQCLRQEHALIDMIEHMLKARGYHNTGLHVWQRQDRRVILAIVDDIEHANHAHSEDFLADLSPTDLVITDATANRPLNCRVIQLPDSWFGIYAHSPQVTQPVIKAFSLPINRIDYNRTFLIMRLYFDQVLDQGLVNFNCVDRSQGPEQSDQQRRERWEKFSTDVVEWYGSKYQRSRDDLIPRMPLRNHDLEHDAVCQAGALQVVVETYCSDHTVCVSEKIFQALCLPRPWIVLSGTWTVARLRQLGFDVMDDVIDHAAYDGARMNDDKIVHLSGMIRAWSENFQLDNWNAIQHRAAAAAEHNQRLLYALQDQWVTQQGTVLTQIASVI